MVGAAGTAPAVSPGAQGAVQRDAGWAMVKAAGMRSIGGSTTQGSSAAGSPRSSTTPAASDVA
eukprot:10945793-Lingulodinium_polyedra.AAC.1